MAYAKSCFVVNPWRAAFESPLLMGALSHDLALFPLVSGDQPVVNQAVVGLRISMVRASRGRGEGQADGLLLPGPSPFLLGTVFYISAG